MADEYFKFWQSDYKPMEQAQIAANKELIPGETALSKAQTGSALELLPGQTEFAKAQTSSALSLLPGQTKLMGAQTNDALTAIGERAPIRTEFYKEALDGVNVEDRANKAAADATQAFMNSTDITKRNSARMGINPNSGRFASMMNTDALNRTKAVAGAKTQARTQAEQENFARLNTAMGYGGAA